MKTNNSFLLNEESAKKGNAEAQFNLGNCYYNGKDIQKDYEKAVYWYTKAAEQGHAQAQYNLGNRYDNGEGIEQDHIKAAQWFTKASEQGHMGAQFNLGICYAKGEGVQQNYEKAAYWYKKAAEQGYTSAQYNLGNCYYYGKGVEQNYDLAAYWYKKAAEQGLDRAQFNLGTCYDNGEGVQQNYEKAAYWYKKAAEQGHASAQNSLGVRYKNGTGVERDYEKEIYWYKKSAEQGYMHAQFNLGVCYAFGEGIEQNFENAVYWFTKAAKQGHPKAMLDLGLCYAKGKGVKQDFKISVDWYTKAAEQNNADAQYNLGNCYYRGEGVDQDYEKAIYWWKKAVEQGDSSAQNNLGYCYYYGNGVKQDYEKAVYWYTKAAELGNAYGQVGLGCCYRDGNGVSQNFKTAQAFFEDVIKNPESDTNILGKAYYNLGTFVMDRTKGFFENKLKAKDYFEKAAYYGYDCKAELDGINSALNLNDDSNNKMGQFVKDLISKGTSLSNLYGEIKDKLSSVFGDVWDMLEEDSKVCLVTACSAYISFASAGKDDYNKFDFSSVITAISKACEIELGKILYNGFRDYLDRKNISPTEFNPETQKFVKENKSKVPSYEKTNEDEKYNYYRQEKYAISSVISYEPRDKKGIFSLGGFAKLAGIGKETIMESRDLTVNGKSSSDNNARKEIIVDRHFLDYMNEVFKENAFPKENRIEKIKGYLNYFKNKVSDIAFNLRNPASHDSVMPYWKAVYCGNSVFMADGFLQDFLRKIKH